MSDGSAKSDQQLLRWVMLAVGVWGCTIALGACLFGYDQSSGMVRFSPNPLRGLIVLGCVGTFVGGWALLLRRRFA